MPEDLTPLRIWIEHAEELGFDREAEALKRCLAWRLRPIDLQRFCSLYLVRPYAIYSPFVVGDWLYATDGQYLVVRVPATEFDRLDFHEKRPPVEDVFPKGPFPVCDIAPPGYAERWIHEGKNARLDRSLLPRRQWKVLTTLRGLGFGFPTTDVPGSVPFTFSHNGQGVILRYDPGWA